MNEVRLSGKVLNCYIHDKTGAFICKLAVAHDHIVGKQTVSCESVFNIVLQDENKINHIDIMQGDKVMVTGYLKLDIKKSNFSDNEHRKVMIYATDIELVKPKENFDMVDYTRRALGM